MCVENDLRNGQTVSSSIMTTLCVTHRFWYGNFCQTKILRCVPIHLIHPPDLAPCDFWLFSKVKMAMKGKRFDSIQDIEAATTTQLKTLTKEDFQNCFAEGGSILRRNNGNVSFTVIFFLFKHSPYFFITPRITYLVKMNNFLEK